MNAKKLDVVVFCNEFYQLGVQFASQSRRRLKAAKGRSQREPMGAQGSQRDVDGSPRTSEKEPKGAHCSRKAAKGTSKDSQWQTKGAPRGSQWETEGEEGRGEVEEKAKLYQQTPDQLQSSRLV